MTFTSSLVHGGHRSSAEHPDPLLPSTWQDPCSPFHGPSDASYLATGNYRDISNLSRRAPYLKLELPLWKMSDYS